MIKFVTIFFFVTILSLEATCKPFYLGLDEDPTNVVKFKNTIVWTKVGTQWRVQLVENNLNFSDLKCSNRLYLLVNNNERSYKTKEYIKHFYTLQRGWNYLPSYKDGVDVEKTFKGVKGVEFVYVYDKQTEVWAGYSHENSNLKKIHNTRILRLKKIEPNMGFYVYAKHKLKVKIVGSPVTGTCKKLIQSDTYGVLTSSGNNKEMLYNKEKSIGMASRYVSHYRRGIYDESRLTLIYPKLSTQEKVSLRYGPAVPKALLAYAKVYEEKEFYIYDHKAQKCYKGTIPSRKIPPFASLKEVR